ncbi:MAG: hypothetical protein JRI74_08175 [Deltaproteobacteria bacterium]|nr:hypothetical protein [Deltaproteobacteria bacterium]MBW2217060.1 hypothetical protein [Deltaproteobacteria bacterium]
MNHLSTATALAAAFAGTLIPSGLVASLALSGAFGLAAFALAFACFGTLA